MAAPSSYKTDSVEIGANTYSKPVQSGIGEAIGGVFGMIGQAEQKARLSEEEQRLLNEREQLFSTFTPAQQKLIAINEAVAEGRELTKEELEFQSNSALLREAVDQGVMKMHQFKRRQEALLRDAKLARPDLAQEFDKLYSDSLGFDVRGAAMDYYNYNLKLTEKLALSQAEKEQNQAKMSSDYIEDIIRNMDVYTKDKTPEQAMQFRNQIMMARAEIASGGQPDIESINRMLGLQNRDQALADMEFRVGSMNPENGTVMPSGKSQLTARVDGFYKAAELIKQEVISGKWDTNPSAVSNRINLMEIEVNALERDLAKYRSIPSLRDEIAPFEAQIKFLRENTIKALRESATPDDILRAAESSSAILRNYASIPTYASADNTIKYMKATGVSFDENSVRNGFLEVGGWLNSLTQSDTPYNAWYVPQSKANKIPPSAFTSAASALTTGKLNETQKAQILSSATDVAQALGQPVKASADGKEIPRDPNAIMSRQGVVGYTLANKQALKTAIKGMDSSDRYAFGLTLLSNLDRYNVARIRASLDANPELPRGMSAGSYANAFYNNMQNPEKLKGLRTYTPVSSQFVQYKDTIAPSGIFIDYDRKAQEFLSFVIDDVIFGE